jgi:non-ribosomal peptide synthase protein (TIGR01720 family)
MVPSAVVVVDEIPLTPNGKVNRRALPPPGTIGEAASTYVAPRTPTETLLAAVWCEVLRLDAVGIHDNFFALGGDSILSLQVIGRARAAGLSLTLNDLMEHATVADLSDLCARASQVALTDARGSSGTLTPVQSWFFDLALDDRNHFNQAIRLELAPDVDVGLFRRAVAELLARHPAFRLRFKPDPGGWHSETATDAELPPLQLVDLSSLGHHEALEAIETHADRYHRMLDIESGPLAQLALFALGSHPPQLVFVTHHLIVDGVSWRILLEDLEHIYLALSRRGGPGTPLPPSATVHEWVGGLTAWSTQTDFVAAVGSWTQPGRHAVAAVPVDHRLDVLTPAATVVESLDAARTTALVHFARSGRTQHVMLAALATTLAEWTGAGSVLFDLEGHGREAAPVDVDVSRTVAWCTAIFPVVLTVNPAAGWDVVLSAVEEQMQAVPFAGIPFGVGRYLSADRALAAALADIPARHVCFNYLGQLDLVIARSQLFRPAAGGSGQARSERAKRPYPIELNCYVRGGRLLAEWTYDPGLHRPATIQRVSGRFMTALREIIPVAQRLSPSTCEFPLANLRRGDLAVLAEKLTTTGRR